MHLGRATGMAATEVEVRSRGPDKIVQVALGELLWIRAAIVDARKALGEISLRRGEAAARRLRDARHQIGCFNCAHAHASEYMPGTLRAASHAALPPDCRGLRRSHRLKSSVDTAGFGSD